jgi:hypothetical protein
MFSSLDVFSMGGNSIVQRCGLNGIWGKPVSELGEGGEGAQLLREDDSSLLAAKAWGY